MRTNKISEEQLNKEYEKLNQHKDKTFKRNINVKGFDEYKSEKKNIIDFYIPDKILENKESILFLESSSTGDRKVHIGELTQFLTFVSLGIEHRNIYFVLFLCGESSSSPTVTSELPRLRFFYKNFSMKNSERAKIQGVYLVNQKDIDIKNLTLEEIKKFDRIDKDD